LEDRIDLTAPPPSFAIVDRGFRHYLSVSYWSILLWVGPDGTPAYAFDYQPLNLPPGMTITAGGLLEFLPTADQSGESYTVDVRVTVSDGGDELFTDVVSFTTRVIPDVPQLTVYTVAGASFGTFGNARTKYAYGLNISMEDAEAMFIRLRVKQDVD